MSLPGREIVPPEPLKRLPDAPGASSGIGQYYAGRCETKMCPHCKVDRVHCGHDKEWWSYAGIWVTL